MNDVMSLGIHRFWKHAAIQLSGIKKGDQVLDLAGGTGDLSIKMSRIVGANGKVTLSDINPSMLAEGKKRLLNKGIIANVDFKIINAEEIPFPDKSLDLVTIGFGLRNVTDKLKALKEMQRVLKPGGRLLILEFSKPTNELMTKIYDAYSFKLLPLMGKLIAKDEDSYRYLAESIRMHPDQESLKSLMLEACFDEVDYHNLSAGIVAIHRGFVF
ncbi:ubiquinone/menaquinone biosynthesis methyltransferase [Gammaproteobacteria bacterium]|nr:ubiquinone/menaquinone biosynthesis methyltransferase [Gammaproteobacteria bacterium]